MADVARQARLTSDNEARCLKLMCCLKRSERAQRTARGQSAFWAMRQSTPEGSNSMKSRMRQGRASMGDSFTP